ncbi:hypothetical protein ABPG74_017464 [Tetrahymena malaccensis]
MKKKNSRQNSLQINSRQRIMNSKSFTSSSMPGGNANQNGQAQNLQSQNSAEFVSRSPSEKKQKQNNSNANASASLSQENQFSLININQVHTYTVGRCGYCQDTKWMTSGFDCAQMSLKNYQLLMDRGWRRCGTYYYKPHVDQCCCRTFSIRLDAAEYKLGSSQKKVLRKFERMLNKQDEKVDIYKKQLGEVNQASQLDQQNQQQSNLLNMYGEYDIYDEDDDDDDEEDEMHLQNPHRSSSSTASLAQLAHQTQANSQSNMKNGSNSNSSSLIRDPYSLTQSSSLNATSSTNENSLQQVKVQKSQSTFNQKEQQKGEGKFESLLISSDEMGGQQNDLSCMDQEIMNEIKERSWAVLRLCLNNIKNNLQQFLDALGVPVNEKTKNLVLDDRIMEQSRLYQNRNMIKHGTHSTNFLITFYRLNINAWGDIFTTKEKFFAKSFTYFETAFDCANQELVKKNIKFKLRTCGEINVHYTKRSFLKRVSEFNILKNNNKKSMLRGNIQSTNNLAPQNQIAKKKKDPTLIIPARRKNFYRIIVKAEFDDESFELYKRYNKIIHNNMKTSKESYKNFLCLNGLRSSSIENSKGKQLNFGCYHFKYYLDDVLIAVSVVDILPEGLSNVYYFYEPDLKKYSLGVIGNLRDIEYIKEYNFYFPNFRYYYLGYYIHNNSKMSYKASYKPFQLLCPITYRWVVFDKVTQDSIHEGESPILSKEKIIDDMDFSGADIEKYVQQKVKLYISGRYIKINQIKQSFMTYFQYLLSKLVTLLGKQLSESLVFGQQ